MAKNKRYKVLIIAGGGVFGVIPSHLLGSLPTDKQDLNKIDLLAGCSVGGILACAYASGNPFNTVDDAFISNISNCFKKRFIARINPISCPKYDSKALDEVLKDVIGKCTLGEVRHRFPKLDLIIPTLNITTDNYKVFDNIGSKDDNIRLYKLAGMTSAAPTYFEGRTYRGDCYIDGGLIEVAPLLTATTALKNKRGVAFEDMDVLMIGTGVDFDETPLTPERYNKLNLLGIAKNVITPYVTMSNEMATRYWGSTIGYNSFTYYNPCRIDGDLDNIDIVPEIIEQVNGFTKDFEKVWDRWLNE